jgi:HD superfamily phosphohydrolase YqeK
LDKGVIVGIDNTIKYILKQGGLIHPNTIEARNYLIINGKGGLE